MITDAAVPSATSLRSSLKPVPQPVGDAAEHILPSATASRLSFADLDLPEPLLRAVTDEGYEEPTPIQAQAIPLLLQGRDVIGQAQTGTGKTAAFSLPLLQRIDPHVQAVQALVLVPTRELALQVATAIHTYAKHLPRVTVLPIFGGDSMDRQMARLGRGIHVVVGTPGRILDHLRRGSLDLSQVSFMVLDEADEMLRMGFLEDVETILSKTPATRQTTLLSATMPPEIRRVSKNHLRNPEHVAVAAQSMTVASTRQCVAIVPENLKLEAVARILETDEPEAALIFTRTRLGASALAEQLTLRGFPAEALHSDLSQSQRLLVLQRLRDRRAQVVVATDVAARGLDIDHISHVINYDLPGESETYVHRIGRTGRAGRVGMAVLLATPYQRPILRTIERFTQRPLELLTLPTYADVARRRRERLKVALLAASEEAGIASYRELCAEMATASERDPLDIAAAALRLLTADRPLFADPKAYDPLARLAQTERQRPDSRDRGPDSRDRGPAPFRSSRPSSDAPFSARPDGPHGPRRDGPRPAQSDMARIVLQVGQRHGIRPGDIVGAIANEAGLSGRDIGRVEINEHESVVEIPAAAMQQVLSSMRSATVRGEAAQPRPFGDAAPSAERPPRPRPDAAPSAERPRPFHDAAPSAERPPRPRPLADAAPSAERPRPFQDAAPSAERPPRPDYAPSSERPQRPRPDYAPSSERPQRPRPFADAAPSSERPARPRPDYAPSSERPQRPRPDYAPSSERPPRPRPFSSSPAGSERPQRPRPDSASGSERPQRPRPDAAPSSERPARPYVQRTEARPRPSDGSSPYHRPPPRERGSATSWTWGAPPPSPSPAPAGQGEQPPKRRP